MKIQMLDSTESGAGYERSRHKHGGIHYINDKKKAILIVEDRSNGGLQYRAMTFFNINKNSSVELAANGITKATQTVKELIELAEKDTATLFGNIFFHCSRIEQFKKLKPLKTMTLNDFKAYLKMFIEKRDRYSYMERLMPGTFRDQIVNQTLIELGYNPMYRNDEEDRLFEKYLSDEEVAEIYRDKY